MGLGMVEYKEIDDRNEWIEGKNEGIENRNEGNR